MPLGLSKICLQIQGVPGKASSRHGFSSLTVLCVLGYNCKGQALPHIPHRVLAGTKGAITAKRGG